MAWSWSYTGLQRVAPRALALAGLTLYRAPTLKSKKCFGPLVSKSPGMPFKEATASDMAWWAFGALGFGMREPPASFQSFGLVLSSPAWGSTCPSGCEVIWKPGGRASPGANLGVRFRCLRCIVLCEVSRSRNNPDQENELPATCPGCGRVPIAAGLRPIAAGFGIDLGGRVGLLFGRNHGNSEALQVHPFLWHDGSPPLAACC